MIKIRKLKIRNLGLNKKSILSHETNLFAVNDNVMIPWNLSTVKKLPEKMNVVLIHTRGLLVDFTLFCVPRIAS